jgi:hypothetical protein
MEKEIIDASFAQIETWKQRAKQEQTIFFFYGHCFINTSDQKQGAEADACDEESVDYLLHASAAAPKLCGSDIECMQ